MRTSIRLNKIATLKNKPNTGKHISDHQMVDHPIVFTTHQRPALLYVRLQTMTQY